MAENDETTPDDTTTPDEQAQPEETPQEDATTAEATDAEEELATAAAEPVEGEDHALIAIQLARDTRDQLAQGLAVRTSPGGGRGKIDPVHVERLTQRLQAYSLLALAEQGHGGNLTPGPGREGTLSISYFSGTTDVSTYNTDGELVTAEVEYADGTTATRGADGIPVLEDRSGTDEGTPGFGVESSVQTTPDGSEQQTSTGSNVPVETPTKARASRKR